MRFGLDAARRRAEAMLNRFPALDVTVKRPVKNKFGERTDKYEMLGSVRVWRYVQSRVKSAQEGFSVREAAQNYTDDDAFWLCMPIKKALPIKHGDVCLVEGKHYVVHNIERHGALLAYWQLQEMESNDGV